MKSPCGHGISLHSSLSPTPYEFKKKKRRARSWMLPMRYSFHNLTQLCSRFLRPHRPLLWASRALGLPLSHARGGLPCAPTLKAASHPGWSSQSWHISAPVGPELTEGHQARLWPLQGCDQPHQPETYRPASLGHSCCHPGNKRYIGWGSAYRLHRICMICHQLHFLHKSSYF